MTTIIGGTTGIAPAQWTTAGRPSSPQRGQFGMNTTTNNLEWWDSTTSTWLQLSQPAGYSVNYLVVAGGGGGGRGRLLSHSNSPWVRQFGKTSDKGLPPANFIQTIMQDAIENKGKPYNF